MITAPFSKKDSGIFTLGPRGGIRNLEEYKRKIDEKMPKPPRVVIKNGISTVVNDSAPTEYVKAKRGMHELSKKGGVQKIKQDPYGRVKHRKVTMVNGIAIVAPKKENTQRTVSWECNMCTMKNNYRQRTCTVCESPRVFV